MNRIETSGLNFGAASEQQHWTLGPPVFEIADGAPCNSGTSRVRSRTLCEGKRDDETVYVFLESGLVLAKSSVEYFRYSSALPCETNHAFNVRAPRKHALTMHPHQS